MTATDNNPTKVRAVILKTISERAYSPERFLNDQDLTDQEKISLWTMYGDWLISEVEKYNEHLDREYVLEIQIDKLRSSSAKKDRVIKRLKKHVHNLERNIEGRAKAIERYRTREAKLIKALKDSLNIIAVQPLTPAMEEVFYTISRTLEEIK